MLRVLLSLAVLAGLAACGSAPPPPSSSSSPGGRAVAYRADREACDAAVPEAVNKRNAKTGLAWFSSPIRRWGQIDEGMDACMAGKGWGRERACTADELRGGNRTPGLVVAAAGVRCTDPPTR